MERNVKVLPPEELMEQLLELMQEAGTVPLVLSGGSMTPFLVGGRDTVYLSNIDRELKKGDMVLYRRDSGAYVLHRICAVTEDCVSCVGDAQTLIERGLRRDQMLALVTAVRRKGRLLRRGSFWWMVFEKLWIRLIPLRPWILAAYSRVKR